MDKGTVQILDIRKDHDGTIHYFWRNLWTSSLDKALKNVVKRSAENPYVFRVMKGEYTVRLFLTDIYNRYSKVHNGVYFVNGVEQRYKQPLDFGASNIADEKWQKYLYDFVTFLIAESGHASEEIALEVYVTIDGEYMWVKSTHGSCTTSYALRS